MNEAKKSVVDHLSPQEQRILVEDVRSILRKAPLVRPVTPNGTPMRVRVSAAGKLGWVGDGAYRYSDRQANGDEWPILPLRWAKIADDVAGKKHPWDSAIINWYDPDAALGWHRDLAEATRGPIVTISLGDACSWAVRLDDESPISRTRLESGDVTLLDGPTRLHLHTVERIIPAPLFSPLKTRGRVSITIRKAGP